MNDIDLEFKDWTKKLLNDLGKSEWITLYLYDHSEYEWKTFYSALVPNNKIKNSLKDPSWDLGLGNGMPGFVFSFKNGKEIGKYLRFSHKGVEPLVICRHFRGIKKEYFDITSSTERSACRARGSWSTCAAAIFG